MITGEQFPLGYPCKGCDVKYQHEWFLYGITGLPEPQISVINTMCKGWWGWRFTSGPDMHLVLSFEQEDDLVQCKLCVDTSLW